MHNDATPVITSLQELAESLPLSYALLEGGLVVYSRKKSQLMIKHPFSLGKRRSEMDSVGVEGKFQNRSEASLLLASPSATFRFDPQIHHHGLGQEHYIHVTGRERGKWKRTEKNASFPFEESSQKALPFLLLTFH